MPAPTLQPNSIQLIGEEFAVAWSNGEETYLTLETLRRACPCAACGGEPDVLGRVIRPEVSYGPKSFSLRTWQGVGGYALQPFWQDGHQSGLYSYAYLRRLGGQS